MFTITKKRIGATTAALLLLGGAALAGPVLAKGGADDNPAVSDDSASQVVQDDNPSLGDDSSGRSPSRARASEIARGSCTATTEWKLQAKPRDGGMEVELEVDSNVTGQVWAYTLTHAGTVMASGTQTTQAPSGSFNVERRFPAARGVDMIQASAMNASTGETCQASLGG